MRWGLAHRQVLARSKRSLTIDIQTTSLRNPNSKLFAANKCLRWLRRKVKVAATHAMSDITQAGPGRSKRSLRIDIQTTTVRNPNFGLIVANRSSRCLRRNVKGPAAYAMGIGTQAGPWQVQKKSHN